MLIDGTSRRSRSDWQGRSEDNRVVNFPRGERQEVGDIVRVLITRAGAHSLVGEALPSAPDPPGAGARP